jgi:hypothetical protein
MCNMDHNLSGHNHGMQPYYDITLEKKKKKKKKMPATSDGGSVGIAIACGIAGALLSRGIRYVSVKFVPMENQKHKRAIGDGCSAVIGGGAAFTFKNPYLKSIGAGMVAESVVDGGMLVIEYATNKPETVNKYTSDSSESADVNGTDDNDYTDYPDRVEGNETDYHYEEPLTTVDINGFENENQRDNKDYW